MLEGASQIDLQILNERIDYSILKPTSKKQPLYLRTSGLVLILLSLLGIVATFTRWLQSQMQPTFYPIVVVIFFITTIFIREKVKEIYIISEVGVHIPYTWFYRRTIPFNDIVRVVDDTIEDEASGRKYAAIRILLDTTLAKFNITGMQTSNILLTNMRYNSLDLNRFADEIMRYKRLSNSVPNTLAQRLTDQVSRSWQSRWRIIILNVFDGVTEGLIYIFLIEAIIWGLFGTSIWPILGLILLSSIFVVILFVQLLNKPQAILGIRPHELGPLIYDEEELITSVRFIIICYPYTVHLKGCELIYPDGVAIQVGRLHQIQPQYVESGELTYGIAQIIGNHTKAKGANLTFSYKEKETDGVENYQIPIEWA